VKKILIKNLGKAKNIATKRMRIEFIRQKNCTGKKLKNICNLIDY